LTQTDPLEIIARFYAPGSPTWAMLVHHGKAVARKALDIAAGSPFAKSLDLQFVEEAAMLHDIGIFLTHTPELGCAGVHPYVCHGVLGNRVLRAMGLTTHGRVCERHVGVGISVEDIQRFDLPLPPRDMIPETPEEELICYADKFHSKNGVPEGRYKALEEIEKSLKAIGEIHWNRFREWAFRFEGIRLN